MVAPVAVRRFAAVEVAVNYGGTYVLNYQRLLDSIEMIKLLVEANCIDSKTLAVHMRDLFPTMSPYDIERYTYAAHECFIHGVNP